VIGLGLANKDDEDLVKLCRQGRRRAWQVLKDRYERPTMDLVTAITNMGADHVKRLAPNPQDYASSLLAFFDQLFDEIANELKGLSTEPDDFAIWLYRFILKRLELKGPKPFRISPSWAKDKEEAALMALVCLGEHYPNYQKAVVLKACAKRWSRWSRSQSKLIDLSYEDIGKILADDPANPLSPACVKNWYRRGLEKIEEYLISAGWL